MYELALSQSEQDSQLPILNLFEFCLDIGEHFTLLTRPPMSCYEIDCLKSKVD